MKRIIAQVFGPFPSYEDARAEAHTACRRLGLLFGRPVDSRQLEIGDMVRTAWVGGWEACESRLVSPDMADAIAHAIDLPSAVLEHRPGESDRQLRVRAIQQVIAYGLAKR
jgi:hypothetical protein